MKQLFTSLLFSMLFSNISFADSTTVKMCYYEEISFPYYTTINKEINRFDSLGQLIQNETFVFEFVTWNQVDTAFRLNTRTDYGYTFSGLLDTMLQTQMNFNTPYYLRFNYLYNVSGNLIQKLRFAGGTFPLDSNLRTIYQYDSNNNLITESEEQYVSNQFFWTSILYRWSYDSLDRNTESRTINYQNNIPHDSLIDTYNYSTSDKILSKKELAYATILDSTYFDYVYNLNDSLIKYTDYPNSTSTYWIPFRTYEYLFTGDSTIELILNCPDTTCSDTLVRNTIVRDSGGRSINNLREEYDGGNSWFTTRIETHAYNVIGNIVDYYEHQSGSPGCSTDEHITYDYNSFNDLIHTHTNSYHCNEYSSDCYYYNVDTDSILVLIDYNDTTCSNTSVPFVITIEGGTPPYQYDWTPGNYLSDSTVLHPSISNFDTTLTYTLLVTDAIGRTATDSMKLFGYPDLYVPITITAFGIPCENNSFSLTLDSIPLNYYFYWILPNSSTLYNDTIQAAYSGNYNLFLTDSNRCKYSYPTNVNLFPSPLVSLGADTTVCLNDTVVLFAGNFAQYSWNTGTMSDTIEVYSQTPSTDTFFVYVTDTNGCTNSDTISVSFAVCLGQDDIYTSGIKVTVYQKQIQVELPSSIPSTEFTIIDFSGRVVIDLIIHDHQSIDTSNLPAGIYVYHLENHSGKFQKID